MTVRLRGAGHRVLVVEDKATDAEQLTALVQSRGDDPVVVGTVDDALAALHAESFCYVLLDQELPRGPKDLPTLAGGQCVLTEARLIDPRKVGHSYVMPIVVVTSRGEGSEDFISTMWDLGGSGFMSKPIKGKEDRLLDKIRSALAKVGKGVHSEGCVKAAEAAGNAEVAAHATQDVDRADPSGAPPATFDVGAAMPGGIAAQLGAKKFTDLTIRRVDGHTVRVICKRKRLSATYIDLGLATKTRNPTMEWKLLVDVCEGHGVFRWKTYGTMTNAKQRVSVLQAKMRKAFGLEDNPFHKFRVVDGWRAKFFATADGEGTEG